MFDFAAGEDPKLDETIDNLIDTMSRASKHSDEYAKMVDQLVKLYPLKEVKTKSRVSPDTLATIAANLFGIMLIVRHERENVVTSKALTFVRKLF